MKKKLILLVFILSSAFMFVDFPQHCFASTLCKLFEPDQDWSLEPFCGQSHCHMDERTGRLFEIVLDCGPKPTNPESCKVI
jgi:hypothetical protein